MTMGDEIYISLQGKQFFWIATIREKFVFDAYFIYFKYQTCCGTFSVFF
jgi:hypothetical protein